MINNKKNVRWARAVAGVAVLATVAGCSGSPSESDNAAPEAVESSESQVPEINDPAVEASALRPVDACALFNDRTIGELGTFEPQTNSALDDWGECSVDVQAQGKTVELMLTLGGSVISVDEATEKLNDLPLAVDDETAGECSLEAVTSREQEIGLDLQVTREGDACGTGKAVLGRIIDELRGKPRTYADAAGSVLALDPCEVADKQAVTTALGHEPTAQAENLHDCVLWAGEEYDYPAVQVTMAKGVTPEEGEDVDLGHGVTAKQSQEDTGSDLRDCTVNWEYRPLNTGEAGEEGFGEIVTVAANAEPEDGVDIPALCAKAASVARTIVPKLGDA